MYFNHRGFLFMGMFYGSINHTTSGRKKRKTAFRPCATVAKQPSYADIRMEEAKKYPSRDDGTVGATPRKERQQYTGTLVKGIGTMHKSNAVPVIDEEQMKILGESSKNNVCVLIISNFHI